MMRTVLDRLRRRPWRRGDPLGRGFAALYQRAPLGIAALSPAGRFLRANAALCRFFGYTEGELRARAVRDLLHPDDVPSCVPLFEKVRSGELGGFEVEKRYIRKDGETVWARIAVAAVPARGGAPRETVGVAVDVTARKKAEEALKASQEAYRSLYNRTPAMMHSIDPEGRLLSVSDRWLATLGYERGEVLGRPSVEFMTPESRARAEERVLPEFFRTGSCTDVPYRFVKRDGTPIDVLLSATCERDAQGRIVRSLAVLEDVTERLRAEADVRRLTTELEARVERRTAELERRRILLSAQLEASPDGIMVADERGRVLSCNRRFVEMWGLEREALAGLDEAALCKAGGLLADPERELERVRELYARPEERSFDELRLRDGRIFERFSSPVVGEDGSCYGRVWYFHDVTARLERERAIREKSAELARSNADLEVYAYATSHDLAAPLRKIVSFGDILDRRAGAKLDEEERDLLRRMRRAAASLSELIADILALSRIGREERPAELVELKPVMDEVLAELGARIAETKAEISVGPLPAVRAHRPLLKVLLANLVSNALKFRRPDASPRVVVSVRRARGGVELVVRDNGIGFEPRFAEKIFEPLRRLHASGQYAGRGLGLAVCRRVAERYGGRITAASRPGRGATFSVWLPRAMIAREPGSVPPQ